MKKFQFSLDTVKGYKDKMLENIKLEHGLILTAIAEQEELLRAMEEQKQLVQEELNEKNAKGITPYELMNYQRYLKVLQSDIAHEYEKLFKLHAAEEAKREELIEMKKETTSFEKLEQKRRTEYDVLVRKSQEQFIEEFVSNKTYAKR